MLLAAFFNLLLPNSLKSLYLAAFRSIGASYSNRLWTLELRMYALMSFAVFVLSTVIFWMILQEGTLAVLLAKILFELVLAFLYHNELLCVQWTEAAEMIRAYILLGVSEGDEV